MDKLQPLIKHHFWICFGLAVLLTTIGWSMANGSLSEAIDARSGVVNGAFSDAGKGTGSPNKTWVDAVRKFNEDDRADFQMAADQLRERQKQARKWPESVRDEMQGIKFLDQITNQITREKWAAGYRNEVEELLQIVEPFDGKNGLVSVDSSRITRRDYNSWRTKVPQSKEIWDAQEDIWLLRSLLTSIAAVNVDAKRILDSSVREIIRLHLRGGDRNAQPASSTGGGMSGMGDMGKMGSMGAMGGIGEDSSEGGISGLGQVKHPGSGFEGGGDGDILGEEFGAAKGGSAGGVGGMGGFGGSMGSMGSMGMAGGMGAIGEGGGMGGGSAAAAEEVRYVDEVEGSYKTRAFLLDVRVMDEKLPELLAKLTDSDFPVEIVRVEITSMGGGGGGTTGGMMSGYDGEDGGGMMGGPGMMGGSGKMSGPGMGGSGMLTGGAGGSGMMGAPGLGGPEMGGSGMMGPSGLGGSGMMGGEFGGTGGQSSGPGELAAALSDRGLLTVRIGGLMTLYQSAEETDAGEKTEAAGDQEESTAAPPTITAPEESDGGVSGASDTDGSVVPGSGNDPASAAPAAGEVPADGGDGAAPAAPATDAAGTSDSGTSESNVGESKPNGAAEEPAGQ